ncbi:GGDEF domain-containing protein [Cupriavidus plantarum]|uniref:diguanylate cyclase n=1 Tax=Cupriavidus plantarum TaxID=942865 RepID=A0A316EMR9_9BURK|nr:GGDEF domain-containing protein [Cupriavidus plantarum]PWK33419.1 diguanylate cyclase (GGDEF)-like protein [Cupriavidus plantarum]RLK30079.1 diguanylate cyclase (GGDEF)-like protein [Cupriavidus plantarum]
MPLLPPVRSIRNRMIVLFIVATTTTLGAFAAHRQWQLRQDLEQRFERTRVEVTDGLRQSLAGPAWALNVDILRTALEATLIHPEVTGACIYSPDGQEIYAEVHRPAMHASACSATRTHDVLSEVTIYPPDDIDADRRAQPIGKAIIRFTRDNMRQALRAAMVQGLTEVVAIDVVLVLLLTFGLRMVFGPLEHLRTALFRLASSQGDRLDELSRLGRTEFDSVIDGFNRVLRRLQATQAELVEKNRQLEVVSKTDQLTGVFNRRHLDEVLNSALAYTRHDGMPFSIILLDVDRFKSVNDTYGHQVGDRVLVEIARCILEVKRVTDTVGRWGGEEFLLICADTNLDDAVRFAETLRDAIATRTFSVTGQMTASLGVACVQDGDTIHGTISRADQALYRGKERGRNRVEYAPALEEPPAEHADDTPFGNASGKRVGDPITE